MARRRRKFKLSRHHVVPQSRIEWGDKDADNIVLLPPDFHSAWHFLFENMTTEEVVEFIRTVMVPGMRWSKRDLVNLRDDLIRWRAAA